MENTHICPAVSVIIGNLLFTDSVDAKLEEYLTVSVSIGITLKACCLQVVGVNKVDEVNFQLCVARGERAVGSLQARHSFYLTLIMAVFEIIARILP